MLLVIDAGNTNVTLGAYKGNELIFVSRLATDRTHTEDQIAIDIKDIFNLYDVKSTSFRGAIISCVVPEITLSIRNAVEKLTGHIPMIVGPGLKTGLDIKVDSPAGLGGDLVAGAVGAIANYKLPCLVMDLGTATKVSVIDEGSVYRGCTISPGIAISLAALANGASQLPQISLLPPDHVIGTNNIDCMRAGIIFGTADMLDGLCERIEKELGTKVETVVSTGGFGSIAEHCKHDVIIDPDLLLKGLKVIYDKNV